MPTNTSAINSYVEELGLNGLDENILTWGNLYTYNRSVNLTSDLYLFIANNGIKFYIDDKFAIGFSVGYTYGLINDSWTINYEFESINNVPDLDFYGTSYSLTLYYGS